jgi:hypothetical protein
LQAQRGGLQRQIRVEIDQQALLHCHDGLERFFLSFFAKNRFENFV